MGVKTRKKADTVTSSFRIVKNSEPTSLEGEASPPAR